LPRREIPGPYRALLAGIAAVALGFSQSQPAVPRSQVAGTVTAVDAAANHLALRSDQGASLEVTASERTLFLRIPPGETDPKKGTKIALASIAAGDRAVIVGAASSSTAWTASAVLIMSRSDVASLQQKDTEDWRRRGTTGLATAIDPAARTVVIKSGSRSYTVETGDKTEWHRYSPDSARFADATSSSLAEVKAGDQLRVLGNKSEDGTKIRAEKIVFGSFRQIAATVSAIDAARGELTVKDLATKKPLIVRVNADTAMRKLPEQMARMLARRYAPGAQGDTVAAPGAAQAAPGGRSGRGGGGDIGQMLDSLAAMPLTELKTGDAVMVSTTQGSDPGKATAVMLLAGVEPLLTASPTATRDIMSGWNLGGGGGDSGQ